MFVFQITERSSFNRNGQLAGHYHGEITQRQWINFWLPWDWSAFACRRSWWADVDPLWDWWRWASDLFSAVSSNLSLTKALGIRRKPYWYRSASIVPAGRFWSPGVMMNINWWHRFRGFSLSFLAVGHFTRVPSRVWPRWADSLVLNMIHGLIVVVCCWLDLCVSFSCLRVSIRFSLHVPVRIADWLIQFSGVLFESWWYFYILTVCNHLQNVQCCSS